MNYLDDCSVVGEGAVPRVCQFPSTKSKPSLVRISHKSSMLCWIDGGDDILLEPLKF